MTIHLIYSEELSRPAPMLVVHGGAGARTAPLDDDLRARYEAGLQAALSAGRDRLNAGAAAIDVVCAAVVALEDDPVFNSGHGAALTAAGTAELDAAVMTGDGRAGAVAASRCIRNPVLAARAVAEQTDHVLIVDPDEDRARSWGLATVPQEYFITEYRRHQLREVLDRRVPASRHGTVGAVALDRNGHVACATSTGGIAGQALGRVGDTALIGAGSFASDDSVAVSCTGEGEAYIRGCVSHDIAARVRYLGSSLRDAVCATYRRELEDCGATGGTIAVSPRGEAVIIHNSDGIFAGYWTPGGSGTFL